MTPDTEQIARDESTWTTVLIVTLMLRAVY